MRKAVARALMRAALRMMPRARRDWAQAMSREFEEIEDAGQALGWAIGVLASACRERGLPLLVFGGRTIVAALTAVYAIFHLLMAINGLTGAAARPAPSLLAAPLILYMSAMAVTHLGAAVFLFRWRPRPFFRFAIAGFVVSLCVTIPGAVMTWGRSGSIFWAQTLLAAMLIGAAMIFARLDRMHRRYA